MDFIVANKNGEELGYIRHDGVNLNVGTDNSFEIRIQNKYYDKEKYWYEGMFFCPETEYGGIITGIEPVTGEGIVKLKGATWRGILDAQPIYEAKNDYLYLNGEANAVLASIISRLELRDWFAVSSENSGIVFKNYKVPLQSMFQSAFLAALEEYGGRLEIKYMSGQSNDKGFVSLSAKKVVDYSDTIEISEDGQVQIDILDWRGGVNHLICLGQGELTERQRVDLYVGPNGGIQKTPYYTGVKMRTQYFEDTNAEDTAELEVSGRKRLKEVMDYKQLKISVSGMDLELGDIIGGRERVTGITMASPVVRKIVTITGRGKETIQYKLKGED